MGGGPRTNLWSFAVKLGLKVLAKDPKLGAMMLVNPIAYWRNREFEWTIQALDPRPSDTILDVGSPKFLSVYLAGRIGATVKATDILTDFIPRWTKVARICNPQLLESGRYSAESRDARELSFSDASFSKLYSISVLEHIPEDGDSKAIAEMARVTRPGGKVAVTVPFRSEYCEDWVSRDVYERALGEEERILYQRRYDSKALQERLIGPSGMALVRKDLMGERLLPLGGVYNRWPMLLRWPLLPFQPAAAKLCLVPVADEEKARAAFLLFQKP